MSRRISLDPKILPMIFDTCPPILSPIADVARLIKQRWMFLENQSGISQSCCLVRSR